MSLIRVHTATLWWNFTFSLHTIDDPFRVCVAGRFLCCSQSAAWWAFSTQRASRPSPLSSSSSRKVVGGFSRHRHRQRPPQITSPRTAIDTAAHILFLSLHSIIQLASLHAHSSTPIVVAGPECSCNRHPPSSVNPMVPSTFSVPCASSAASPIASAPTVGLCPESPRCPPRILRLPRDSPSSCHIRHSSVGMV